MSLLLADLTRDRARQGLVTAQGLAREFGADPRVVEDLLLGLAAAGLLDWSWHRPPGQLPVRAYRPTGAPTCPGPPPNR